MIAIAIPRLRISLMPEIPSGLPPPGMKVLSVGISRIVPRDSRKVYQRFYARSLMLPFAGDESRKELLRFSYARHENAIIMYHLFTYTCSTAS